MKKRTMYGLRTCNADMTSCGGFKWKAKGRVTAPDWDERAECGNGLHFLPMGEGDGSLLNWDIDAKWLVIRPIGKVVDIRGKSKCKSADVVYCGDRKGATDWIVAYGADPAKCVGVFATAGDGGTATAGNFGTATAGYGGTATAGNFGTATAGYGGTATAGYGGSIILKHRTGNRYMVKAFNVGIDGIKPNTPYKLDDNGNIVEAA
jgi:hypothetical protein